MKPFIAAVVTIALGMAVEPALAHSNTKYYTDGKWASGLAVNFWFADHDFDSGGVAGSGSKARIEEGHGAWTALPPTVYFVPRGYNYTLRPNCGQDGYNVSAIFWTPIDGHPPTTNIVALTESCRYSGGGSLHSYVTTFDRDNLWHSGTNAPPPGRVDVRGVATHEAGHAMGQVVHWNEEEMDFLQNPTLCNYPGYPHHTMCLGGTDGSHYEKRSLEAHDRHTFEAAYP